MVASPESAWALTGPALVEEPWPNYARSAG